MKILLIDNTKAEKFHFTRLLEKRMNYLIGEENVVCCSTIIDVVGYIQSHDEEIDAAILSGSTLNLSQPNRVEYIRKSLCALLRLNNIPVLGICFGMQLISMAYGGVLDRLKNPYQCEVKLQIQAGSILFHGKGTSHHATLSHQDYVIDAPKDFNILSRHNQTIQVIEAIHLLRFGVQFHPEKDANGAEICVLTNFFRFVKERITLPCELQQINEDDRIRFLMILLQTNNLKKAVESTQIKNKHFLMGVWRHHMRIWNMKAILL